MILNDVFERFTQDAPLSVMAQGIMENALNPQILDQLFEDVAREAVHPQAPLLHDRRPDERGRLPHPALDPRRLSGAGRDRRGHDRCRLRQARRHRDRRVGRAGPDGGRAVASGHRRDGRRPGGLAARLSRPDPRRQPPPRLRAPAQGVADDPRRGLARPGAGRARPPADAGHRRGPVRRRPCPGAIAAGPDPGDRRGQGPLDRRPQLLHDRLPLRDRAAGRLLRDPTARLDAPLGVRRQAAGLRPDRDRQGLSSRRSGPPTTRARS